MIDFSSFRHKNTDSLFPHEVPISKDYKVYLNGQEIPVYTCRISAYPFNTWWPGHQRQIEQSEIVSYVNLVSDEEVNLEVEPLTKTAYEKIMIKPYSMGVKAERKNGRIVFSLKENGGYVLELDDYHGLLYIFNNKPVTCKDPAKVTYYFGKGIHFPGKIQLKSNESIYVDKDALVYGCIFAENAENLHIYGNGIFDDSGEERFSQHCYESYTNGNVKFYDCKKVKLEGLGFTNSAIWCINLFHCFDVDIKGINVFGQWRYNTDGIDIVNSQRVTIQNSFVHSFDDSITVKGIDRYADTCNTDMLFENCVLWCDWGRTCEIGLETMCREYKNITFRNCNILRGGSVACDIQNGDCAQVHQITFENIYIELEDFYTCSILQGADEEKYHATDTLEIASIVSIDNTRFREMKLYSALFDGICDPNLEQSQKDYASVHDIVVKNICVFAGDHVIESAGTKCVCVNIKNVIDTTKYRNITIENIQLNGNRLDSTDMNICTNGIALNDIEIK